MQGKDGTVLSDKVWLQNQIKSYEKNVQKSVPYGQLHPLYPHRQRYPRISLLLLLQKFGKNE